MIARLLAKSPEQRFRSASEVLGAIGAACDRRFDAETLETRESILQVPPFVDRVREMGELSQLLTRAIEGRGTVCFIGAESGAGKSRLTRELGVSALVQEVLVLPGQAVANGGRPFEPWREVLRRLVLIVELTDHEASVLLPLVPDLAEMIGRPVEVLPEEESTAQLSRLLGVLEDLFRRHTRPTLVVLEDLQWAGGESLLLLSRLARSAATMPILFVGTVRDDEAPALPAQVPEARMLRLGPLPPEHVREISERIAGPSGSDPRVIDHLLTQTEGNPFFLIEVLRALAEESGSLAQLAPGEGAPAPLGIRRYLQRRLERLPARAHALMRHAAAYGRRIDLPLLSQLASPEEVEEALRAADTAAVLEADGEGWRFRHDKLRDELLAALEINEKRRVHRAVAAAVEAAHPDDPGQLAILAHLYTEAEDGARAAHFAERAGIQALREGAYHQAVSLFEGALAHHTKELGEDALARRGELEALFTEAHYRLGDLEESRRHAESALALFGDPMPRSRIEWARSVVREVTTRLVQTLRTESARAPSDHELTRIGREARLHSIVSESYLYALDAFKLGLAVLRLANRCAAAGPSPLLARSHVALGIMLSTTPASRFADRLFRQGMEMVQQTGSRREKAWVVRTAAVFDISCARWETARARVEEAIVDASEDGDRRLVEEGHSMLGMTEFYQGRYPEGLARWTKAHELAVHSRNVQIQRWGLFGRGDQLVRLGRAQEARVLYDEALGLEGIAVSEVVWGRGMRALARLREGALEVAREEAIEVMAQLDPKRACAYWTLHGCAAIAEVLVAAYASGRFQAAADRERVERALGHLRTLAWVVPMAKASATLWGAAWQEARGKRTSARDGFARARALAEGTGLRYEAGLAAIREGRLAHAGGEGLIARGRQTLAELGAPEPPLWGP